MGKVAAMVVMRRRVMMNMVLVDMRMQMGRVEMLLSPLKTVKRLIKHPGGPAEKKGAPHQEKPEGGDIRAGLTGKVAEKPEGHPDNDKGDPQNQPDASLLDSIPTPTNHPLM